MQALLGFFTIKKSDYHTSIVYPSYVLYHWSLAICVKDRPYLRYHANDYPSILCLHRGVISQSHLFSQSLNQHLRCG